jgi:hypothetical protein
MADLGHDAGARPPFSRIVTPELGGAAREGRIEADAGERARLAQFYRIDDLAALTLDYRFDPLPPSGWRLTGELRAALTQRCVVTVEPVAEQVHEAVSLEFWPEHLLSKPGVGQHGANVGDKMPNVQGHKANVEADTPSVQGELPDSLEADPPEPMVGGRIDLGALAAEIFASAINPYPRKSGVEFDWTDPKAAAGEAAGGPFAALARLKGKP